MGQLATCDDRRPYICLHLPPSLLIQSKGGSRSSRFVRFIPVDQEGKTLLRRMPLSEKETLCVPLPTFPVAAVAEWYRYRTVAGLVTGSSPVPLKTRRVGQRCTLNLSRAETSSRWCGVVVRREVPTQVSSTSLDHGSKLRGPSPKALV
ncbi:uncharacterized protein TNCV_3830811 [Trichonephila clavipes]|nr:uncharacterized protein TNCV_3830811 [Trichonephila clavipes]